MTTPQLPRGPKPMPDAVLCDRLEYRRQAKKFAKTGLETDRPDYELLVSGLPEWRIGLLRKPELMGSSDRPFFRLWFKRPGGGETYRDVDPETLDTFQWHCAPGGRLSIEPSGANNDYFYLRLNLARLSYRERGCRAYGLRLIVATDVGRLTKEFREFHDLRRCVLGRFGQGTPGDTRAWIGVATAMQDTINLARDRLPLLPNGLDEKLVKEMLEDGYRLLHSVPLGHGEPEG